MKRSIWVFVLAIILSLKGLSQQERLIYHDIKVDKAGNIIPWYGPEPGKAWSKMIDLVWHFWDTMRIDLNGLPYYMNHQVWRAAESDPRGIGGDQLAMALSSWRLLYAYTGNERVKENMRFMADYYLTHGLSPSTAAWPDLPFPYNSLVYAGTYDGDMVIGKDYTQPDKAGSFALELVHLYKMTSSERYPNRTYRLYLDAAVRIANTLARHTKAGDHDHSPLPFKVNAFTNEVGEMQQGNDIAHSGLSEYTTNYAATLELFLQLQTLQVGDAGLYRTAFDHILSWMKEYPLQNNRWGPFFEDIPGWSDTQINAITFAQFMMDHPDLFPQWRTQVQGIFDWVYEKLGNRKWEKYGVVVVNEQTAYQTPGNSHTSRQASAELQYMSLTGDRKRVDHAIRQLNWATYMVDADGKNRYPQDENWLTDGYGDYVRHYLRAMAAMPELAPIGEDHLLSSTSIIQQADYRGADKYSGNDLGNYDRRKIKFFYRAFDSQGVEKIRLASKPSQVLLELHPLSLSMNETQPGYGWQALAKGGILTVRRTDGRRVIILD